MGTGDSTEHAVRSACWSRRLDEPLSGQLSACHARRIRRLRRSGSAGNRYRSIVSPSVSAFYPLLRVGRGEVANPKRSYGKERRGLLSRSADAGIALAAGKGHHTGGVPPTRKRYPSASRNSREDKRSAQGQFSRGEGLYLLRALFSGLLRAPQRAHQFKGKAIDICKLHSNGVDCRPMVERWKINHACCRCICYMREYGWCFSPRYYMAHWEHGRNFHRRS